MLLLFVICRAVKVVEIKVLLYQLSCYKETAQSTKESFPSGAFIAYRCVFFVLRKLVPVIPRTDLGQSVLPDVEAGPMELTRDVLHLDDPDLQLVLAWSQPGVGQVEIAW